MNLPSPNRHNTDQTDQDHHLWRNGRLWWVAFSVHRPNWTAERVRLSLRTDDLAAARRRRDSLFDSYANASDCELSLRFVPRSDEGGAS
jgi:hypothetical protein